MQFRELMHKGGIWDGGADADSSCRLTSPHSWIQMFQKVSWRMPGMVLNPVMLRATRHPAGPRAIRYVQEKGWREQRP